MKELLEASWVQDTIKLLSGNVARVAEAMLVLIGGWILALLLRGAVFSALKRTSLDNKIAEALGLDSGETEGHRVERAAAQGVYYILMTFVAVGFFHVLKIDAVTAPLVAMLSSLTKAIPSLLKAGLVAFVGLMAATISRRLIVFVLDRVGFEGYLKKYSDDTAAPAAPAAPAVEAPTEPKKKSKKDRGDREKPEAKGPSLARTMGDVAYWFVLVITAIPVLEALEIGALARPLASALETITTYLPKVGAAVVLLIVGYALSKVARALVSGVLNRVGLDSAADRVGIGKALRGQALSGMVGTAAMAFILLHFAIAAVGRLQIQEVSEPLSQVLHQIYSFVPKLFVGSLLMTIGVLVSRVVGNIAGRLLASMGFDTLLTHIGLAPKTAEPPAPAADGAEPLAPAGAEAPAPATGAEAPALRAPSDVAGTVVAVLVVMLFSRQVLSVMHLEGLAQLVDGLLQFSPHLLVAVVVLGAGLWAGRWAATRVGELTASSNDPLFKGLGPVVRGVITVLSAMVALQQIGVARQLIAIAFGVILGSLCFALALAFGLGGREVASRILMTEYERRKKA